MFDHIAPILIVGTGIVFGVPIGVGFILAHFISPAAGVVGGIVSFIVIIATAQRGLPRMVEVIEEFHKDEPRDDTEVDE